MSYYNTTNEQGEQLNIFTKKTKKQDDVILEFFEDNPMVEFGASQVWKALFYDKAPITSVRRSITNLVDSEHLEYTGRMRKGMFGRNENLIRLKQSLQFSCVTKQELEERRIKAYKQ